MLISKNKLKELKKSLAKKYALKHSVFVVEGYKNIEMLLDSSFEVLEIYISNKKLKDENYSKIIEKAKNKKIPIYTLKESDFEKIKTVVTSPEILARIKRRKMNLEENANILVLDRISDPGNLGTIMRSALWFNLKNIVLSENSVDLYNSKVVRSSMGAFFYLNILDKVYLPKFLKAKKEENYKIILLDFNPNADSILDLFKKLKKKSKEKNIFLFGNESHGIDENLLELVDYTFYIDRLGLGESLNLASSVSIFLYEYYLRNEQ